MTQSSFPTLHSDNGSVGPDNLQLQCVLQAESNTVVHLRSTNCQYIVIFIYSLQQRNLRQSAIGAPGFLSVQGTKMDSSLGANESGEPSADSSSLHTTELDFVTTA